MTETFDAGKLAEELKALAGDAEALLQSAASGNGTEKQQERIAATLRVLRGRLGTLEEQASLRARELDGFVRDNPWQSMAIAGCAGLLLGLMLARR